jgi:hypothetical protein
MVSDFDEFARNEEGKKEGKKQKGAKLARETKPEWAALKDFVSRFASNGKEFEGHKFQWAPYQSMRPHFLNLDNVAVVFQDVGQPNGMPQRYSVRFSLRPAGPHEQWSSFKAPDPQEWCLEPVIEGDTFVWSVPQLGEVLSSEKLAGRIVIELCKYYTAFKKALL